MRNGNLQSVYGSIGQFRQLHVQRAQELEPRSSKVRRMSAQAWTNAMFLTFSGVPCLRALHGMCARMCVCVYICVQNPDMLARLAHADVVARKKLQLLANGPSEALQVC